MRNGQIFVFALGALFFAIASTAIPTPSAAGSQCYFPNMGGFTNKTATNSSGKCPSGKVLMFGKCFTCKGEYKKYRGAKRCLTSCKAGYRWTVGHKDMAKDGFNEGCCKR